VDKHSFVDAMLAEYEKLGTKDEEFIDNIKHVAAVVYGGRYRIWMNTYRSHHSLATFAFSWSRNCKSHISKNF
jgi:hypothetical protein